MNPLLLGIVIDLLASIITFAIALGFAIGSTHRS